MLAATNLILVLLPAFQEPQAIEEVVDGGVRIRKEVVVGADGEPVLHGAYTARAVDGTKLVDGTFKEGLASGRWRYRYPNGDLRMVGSFRDGERIGKWQFRYPAGVVRAEGKFARDRPSGAFTFLTPREEPDPRYSGKYEHVQGDWENGNRRCAGLTLDGKPHGPWTFDWEDGSRMLEAGFDRGEPAGTWRFHHVGGVFDPEFVSTEYPDAFELQGFFEPPALPGASLDPLPTELDLALLPATLDEVPPAPPAPGATDLERRKVEVSIEAFTQHTSEADRKLELERLVLWGPATMQVLLDELREVAWREESGIARARLLVEGILEPLLGGRTFGWTWAVTDEAWATNRLSFLRAYSYYYLTRGTSAVWRIDLALPMAAGETSELLMQPAVDVDEALGREPVPRAASIRAAALRRSVADGASEEALRDGLAWLARHQSPDGSWRAEGFMHVGEGCECGGPGESVHDLGVTALALLALMGDGNTLEEGPYASNVVRGVRWILGLQDPKTGSLIFLVPIIKDGKRVRTYSGAYMYSHAIATQVLCRAFESSNSPVLRRTAQNAVNYIVRARNPYGAWRYDVPPVGANDTSVTCWAVSALLAAERAGLKIDREAYVGASNWVDEVTDPVNGRVGYKSMGSVSARVTGINDHYPPQKGEAMTAMGLLMRFLIGQDPASVPMMSKHADLMLKTLPEWDPEGFGCDMYYWYHGTRAMFRMGGRHWKGWNEALKRAVLRSQRKDGDSRGSWDPAGPWGFAGGRVYSTAMMAMCLEVYFDPR